jgi:hypothetical protein
MEKQQPLRRQTCKVCKCPDKFDFHVPDDVWATIVSPEYRQSVVCLSCFDDLAYKQGLSYAASVKTLYFAGEAARLVFTKV